MKFKNEYLFGSLLLILVISLIFQMFKTFEGFTNDINNNQNHTDKNILLSQQDPNNNNINLMDSYSSPQSLISGNTYNNNIHDDDNNNSINNTNNTNRPNGILRNQIPNGDEDLYILKSQIVPPVCPVCPNIINKCENKNEKCPPCKPCGRCPEPSYECIMKPKFNSDNSSLPIPVLANFSTFGM
jgi:hypothetical protein